MTKNRKTDTEREKDIRTTIKLRLSGTSTEEISKILNISERTIRRYISESFKMSLEEKNRYTDELLVNILKYEDLCSQELYKIVFFSKNNSEKIKAIRELRENKKFVLETVFASDDLRQRFKTEVANNVLAVKDRLQAMADYLKELEKRKQEDKQNLEQNNTDNFN